MKGIDEAKNRLKALMTPENADAIAEVVAQLDNAEQEHKTLQEQHTGLKDKYVNMVSNMTFPEKPKNDGIEPQTKSLDEIVNENLEKVMNHK